MECSVSCFTISIADRSLDNAYAQSVLLRKSVRHVCPQKRFPWRSNSEATVTVVDHIDWMECSADMAKFDNAVWAAVPRAWKMRECAWRKYSIFCAQLCFWQYTMQILYLTQIPSWFSTMLEEAAVFSCADRGGRFECGQSISDRRKGGAHVLSNCHGVEMCGRLS